jgi:outer membrane immunogenic protein
LYGLRNVLNTGIVPQVLPGTRDIRPIWRGGHERKWEVEKSMKKTIIAGVSALALLGAALPAFAADIYRGDSAPVGLKDGPVLVSPAMWQGLYLGGHAGYAWGSVDVADTYDYCNTQVIYAVTDIQASACSGTHKTKFSTDGFIGGGQIGYNFQRGALVFGPEIDLGYLGLNGDKLDGTNGYKYSSKGGFYGDFTGRLGIATGPTLFYVKGGAAFLDAKFSVDDGLDKVSKDNTLWGWTAGGGVEHMLRPNWSVKAEYRHFEFDGSTVEYFGEKVKFEPSVDSVTVGVNYHVNREYSPLK